MRDYHLDDIDRRILYHLASDARNTSASMIAEQVDVTPATIRNRIHQLEDHGIIRSYHAAIDYERSEGLTQVEFTCTAPPSERERLGQQCADVTGVTQVRELTTGRENLRVVAVGRDSDDISRLTRDLSELGLEIDRQSIVHSEFTQPYQPFVPEQADGTTSLTDFRSLSGGAEVVEFTVSEEAPIADRTLADANTSGLLPDDVLVISLERGESIQAPKGDTTIRAGDVLTVFARDTLPDETLAAFGADGADTTPQ